ncbi:MAG: type II toxin-antitoxin system prevent-host-death family antitoxin [Acidobacteriota bacterium]
MFLTYYLTMQVNIYEAKARLSELVEAVESGERVTICRRNRPVAELVRVGAGRKEPRPIGGARGQFVVPSAFFEPLPDAVIETFYPDAERTGHLPVAAERLRVAAPEAPPATPRRRKTRR